MTIIKNRKKLEKLIDNNKDLHLEGQDVRIEFQFTKEELRDIYCNDLFLMNDDERLDFNGGDFNGRNFNGNNFNGRDFNGWNFNGNNFNGGDFNGNNFNGMNFNGNNFNGGDFNGNNFNGGDFTGWNFNGGDFTGGDFTGGNFNGKKVSYWAFFNCYYSIKCESIEGERENHTEPICLNGKLEIIKEEPEDI